MPAGPRCARQGLVARGRASLRAAGPAVTVVHGLAFLRGGMTAAAPRSAAPRSAAPRSAMASWHLRVSQAPSAVTLAISWSGAIWSIWSSSSGSSGSLGSSGSSGSSGSMGASPTSLRVISTARTASVSASIPRGILRQTRRLGPPCLRAFHAPSTLIPPRRFARTGGACRRAVDQPVQRALRTAKGYVDLQGLLATAAGADVRHRPVRVDQPQQALDKPASPWSLGPVAFSWLDLSERHAEQHLHRQAGLDGVRRENHSQVI